MAEWQEIQQEWETSKITLAALAEKHNLKLGTLKSRKSREGWSRGSPKKDATKVKKGATLSKRVQPKKTEFEPVVESENLTDKQRLFCIYYIKYFNATKAYLKAYECAYSTAMVNGHGLLRNTKVSKEIDRLKAEQTSELKIEARTVLQKYIDIALADITDFATFGQKEQQVMTMYGPLFEKDKHGKIDKDKPVMEIVNYLDFKDSLEVDGTIITEVSNGRNGPTVKLADKMKALDFLTKYLEMNPDQEFKKQLEAEKLKIAHAKAFGVNDQEEFEDDGFHEALNATTSEVWGNVDDANEG